ncbi:MAG: outer membrane lipoprotein carrier protein LolA [Alphaproteobacteria bacterium]|nr:outer membrane lipoprotein carrier protein LolA [Alphaproteobacteria bacterium]
MPALFRIAVLALALLAQPDAARAAAKVEPARLNPADAALVQQVEDYLNSIRTMRSRFFQVAPSGAQAEGEILLSRPGKLRIAYDLPVPILIVANGKTIGYYDREVKQAQYLGTDMTPAGILVREKIKLSGGDLAVTRFERGKGALRVTIARTDDPGAGSIALVFSETPLTLRKWYILDAQGQTTEVALLGPQFGVEIGPKPFLFDEMVEDRPSSGN